MKYGRVYNFSAGPAIMPEPVLEEIRDEMMNYRGSGMCVMEMSHRSKVFQQIVDEAEADLRALIKRQKKDIGKITAIIPQKRGRSGYVTQVLVKGTNGNITLSKENVIRNNLAPGMLRSSYFIVVPNYENRQLKNFVFYGGGWGHGVGFCQTGSAGRADAGQDYKDILAHYFPGTELVNKEKE